MFYVLEKDFFSSSMNAESVAYELDKRVQNERVIVNFDVFACHKWTDMLDKSTDGNDDITALAQAYYSELESMNKYQLEWYDLSSTCSYYIDTIGELLVNFNFHEYQVCACGVLPIVYTGVECCMYYHISPYEDLRDKFNFISFADYREILRKYKIGEIK